MVITISQPAFAFVLLIPAICINIFAILYLNLFFSVIFGCFNVFVKLDYFFLFFNISAFVFFFISDHFVSYIISFNV